MDRTEATKSREVANSAVNVGAGLALLAADGQTFHNPVGEGWPTIRRELAYRLPVETRLQHDVWQSIRDARRLTDLRVWHVAPERTQQQWR